MDIARKALPDQAALGAGVLVAQEFQGNVLLARLMSRHRITPECAANHRERSRGIQEGVLTAYMFSRTVSVMVL